MEINFSQIIATIINFAILIAIAFIFVKGTKIVLNIVKSNNNIEKKLDKIIEKIDEKENK